MTYKTSLLLILCGFIFQSNYAIQPVTSFPIPDNVNFGEQSISLERYDMRERFDREQIIVAYNHSNSLLVLKRANRFFPVIEPILKQYSIPDDFKYLAVVESNLDIRAASGVQAAGLWQLMPKTGEQFGLEVNDEVDERYSVEKSTIAACKYFKSAYAKYQNWVMVAASYNAGMGRMSTEQEKQQVENVFDLQLSTETSRYVFRILAFKRFFENPKAFGYELKKEDFYPVIRTQSVTVGDSIGNLTDWAIKHGLSYFQLKDFNVWLRDRKLTNTNKKEYQILIPYKSDLKYDDSKVLIHNPLWIAY